MKRLTILFLLLPTLAFAQKTQFKIIVNGKAVIEMDSKKVGIANEQKPFWIDVKPGKHILFARYENGDYNGIEINAKQGRVTTVNLEYYRAMIELETAAQFAERSGSMVMSSVTANEEDSAFWDVDEYASFQGGTLVNFFIWIKENLQYPDSALKQRIEGEPYVKFMIDKEGNVKNARILGDGVNPFLDAEAVRVIQASPRWTCAKKGGKPVSQLFRIGVTFSLPDSSSVKK
jgi:TonB family protein